MLICWRVPSTSTSDPFPVANRLTAAHSRTMARDDDFADRGTSPVGGWPPDFDRLVIPDDPRELEHEARALTRERRAAKRADRLRGFFLIRRWRRAAYLPVATAMVLLLGAVISVLALFRPAGQAGPKARPLANSGLRADGEVGGLLPGVDVGREPGGNSPIRGLRPALVLLAPASCTCSDLLHAVARTSARHHVYGVVAGPKMPVLPADLAAGPMVPVADTGHGIFAAYHVSDKPVVLLVGANGLVASILSNPAPDKIPDDQVAALAS
jgi:hypothetical protein